MSTSRAGPEKSTSLGEILSKPLDSKRIEALEKWLRRAVGRELQRRTGGEFRPGGGGGFDASDKDHLVQELLVRAWVKRSRLAPVAKQGESALEAYLWKMVRNAVTNHERKRDPPRYNVYSNVRWAIEEQHKREALRAAPLRQGRVVNESRVYFEDAMRFEDSEERSVEIAAWLRARPGWVGAFAALERRRKKQAAKEPATSLLQQLAADRLSGWALGEFVRTTAADLAARRVGTIEEVQPPPRPEYCAKDVFDALEPRIRRQRGSAKHRDELRTVAQLLARHPDEEDRRLADVAGLDKRRFSEAASVVRPMLREVFEDLGYLG